MAKEVQVKQEQALSAEVADLSNWGAPEVLGQDILISKILIMQPSSEMVADGKANLGEFRDSVVGTKLGDQVTPIEVIPFHLQKYWDIHTEEGGQYQWTRSEPLIENPIAKGYNDNLPWQDVENGKPIKRVRRMNFFVLLPSEVTNGQSLPYVLSFRSTSYTEGRKIYSQMYMRNKRANLPPAGYTFKISSAKQKNEKGQSWFVPTAELGRQATSAELTDALYWYKKVTSNVGVKVDDSDMGEREAVATGTGDY
jgi:hypothetical protein